MKNFVKILPVHLKIKLALVVIVMLVVGIFEMFSMGLLIPALTMAISENKDLAYQFELISRMDHFFSNNIQALIISFSIVFITKTIFISWSGFFQSEFIYSIQTFVSNRLYQYRALSTNPSFSEKSSISHEIVNEPTMLTTHFTVPLSIIGSEAAVILGLIILLMVFDPFGTIIYFGISFIQILIFYLLVRKKVERLGTKRLQTERDKAKFVQTSTVEAIGITYLGQANWFKGLFNKLNINLERTLIIQRGLLLLPRTIVEFIMVLSLGLFYMIASTFGYTSAEIISSIILFIAVGARLIPSVNKIAISLQEFKFSRSLLSEISKSLQCHTNSSTHDNSSTYDTKKALLTENQRKILNKYIESKCKILVTGESGSGKSTFVLDLIHQLSRDHELVSNAEQTPVGSIGYVNHQPAIFPLSFEENIFLGRNVSPEVYHGIVRALRLGDLAERFSDTAAQSLSDDSTTVSTGERQRIGIARTLIDTPSLLVLDEALSGLDNHNFEVVEALVLNLTSTCVVHVSHNQLNTAAYDLHITFSDNKLIFKEATNESIF